MNRFAILLIALVALSALLRPQPHFALRATAPMPAVNIP
jgi:hypothetical protein